MQRNITIIKTGLSITEYRHERKTMASMCQKIEHFNMTKAFTILSLFFATLVYGQVSKEYAYKNIEGLTVIDSIAWKDIVGSICKSDGFGGYNFHLDSNMTFRKINFGCMSRFTVDSGSWTIKNKSIAVLKSRTKTLYFDIVKYDNLLFFILPKQRQKFVTDIQSARLQYKNVKPFKIGNKTYNVNYIISNSLVNKYFTKEIEDITGI